MSNHPKFPKISIVMPSYNQGKFIERSILSVLDQNYPNLEFIIIDGGSTDNTIDIIKKYESSLSYWVSEPDDGQSDALNKGFALASGEIYGWLNSDDLYMPNAFFTMIAAFIKYPDKNIVFGDWISIDADDNFLERFYAFNFNVRHFQYEGFHLNAQSMLWRHAVHQRFKKFDINLHNTMDYQMIISFGLNEKNSAFLRVNQILGCFRRYAEQKTGNFHERVVSEHMAIANMYNFMDKYNFIGKIKRYMYRYRRAFWLTKRAGIIFCIKKVVKAKLLYV